MGVRRREMPKSEILKAKDIEDLSSCAEGQSFIGRVTTTIRALAEALEHAHGCKERGCTRCEEDIYNLIARYKGEA